MSQLKTEFKIDLGLAEIGGSLTRLGTSVGNQVKNDNTKCTSIQRKLIYHKIGTE